MKLPPRLIQCVAGTLAFAGLTARIDAAVTLPASAALATNTVSNPGFVVRTAQAPIDVPVANNYLRATRQINGILTDAGGILVSNVALPGPEAGGVYFANNVSFEKEANSVVPRDADGNDVWTFNCDFFPGIPGSEGDFNQFADESVALVVLEPGVYTLALCASADRTDVNDDDGCSVYVGANPRDFFATKVADFTRTTGTAPFTANQRIENQIEVVVPVRGAYPFRLMHWQQSRGVNLQFYVVDTNSLARYLINDSSDPTTPLAYRSSTVPAFNAPYIADITPPPGSAGNSSALQLTVTLFDGATTVNTGSIQLSINGTPVVPVKGKLGSKTTVAYLPGGGWATANNAVVLVYADSLAALHTNTWSFGVNVAGGSTTQVTGQWDFENGDLRATVGTALKYFDTTYDGPSGTNANRTKFGTTTSFGIPDINGQVANVVYVPGDTGAGSRRLGYTMTHGIAPNGGGTRVNQYTLIFDIMCTNNSGAASLIQITDPAVNVTDGDLFWQGANFGQGGYNGTGALTPNTWHRIVAAYDEAASPPVVTKYVDGIKQEDWTANQGLDNDRRALLPTAILFGDGDQDERRNFWVNSIQIRSGKLSDAEMVALGGAEACGIPLTIPQSTVTGQWDFDRGNLSPTIGTALQYFNTNYDNGGTGSNANQTAFGTCSSLGVPLINGVDAKIIQVPGDTGPGSRNLGYVMTHRIAPNGGGTRVNQYTLIFDIMCTNNSGAASLIQITDPAVNVTDGDLFWQGANFGQGGYNGTSALTPNVWHRIVAAYDEAASPPVVAKYVDGIKQEDWTANQGLDNDRRALLPTAILFGDGDQDERRTFWVDSIQIRAGKMSDADIVQIGTPKGTGIPVVVPHSSVAGQWDFDSGNLAATIGAALQYFNTNYDNGGALPTPGSNANQTAFGTCSSFGVPLINGVDAKIIQVPGDTGPGSRNLGYVMTHGIAPNGGGTRVNQYTIIFDIMCTNNSGAASLIQITDPAVNVTDGDLFWQGANFGQGGYNGTSALTPNVWHRIAAAYNEAAAPPVVIKYVDGIFQEDWTANQGLDNDRRTLLPTAILFGDGDQDERRTFWVNSIQIREGALSKPELAALGPPTESGIPVAIPAFAPGVPAVKIGLDAGRPLVTWSGGTLQSATNVVGPYTDIVPQPISPWCVSQTIGKQFFRVRQ